VDGGRHVADLAETAPDALPQHFGNPVGNRTK
jgi:hypothetical protein